MRFVPISFKQACDFLRKHHRHNKPPSGWKFGVGLMELNEMVGAATAGRPVARHYEDGVTLEINRTCTNGQKNANSKLYGAVWRTANTMGYVRCITYTQASESGTALVAPWGLKEKELRPRHLCAESMGKGQLTRMRDAVGNGGVARTLWTILLDQRKDQP